MSHCSWADDIFVGEGKTGVGWGAESQAPWDVGPDVLKFIPGPFAPGLFVQTWRVCRVGVGPLRGSQPHTHSPLSLADPQFIKATIVRQDQAYDDKIYYFFREDNPDKNPEAPLNVSRVAQLCRVSGC